MEASPSSGNAPLTVKFNAKAFDTSNTTITRYNLSFGDNSSSWSNYFGGHYNHVYEKKGTYTAVLTATNAKGLTAVDQVIINVNSNPPIAYAKANPSNGSVPLIVNFTASGTDLDGQIELYEWDFDGDGEFDFSSTSSGNATYSYTQEGEFHPVFRITDDDGLRGTANLKLIAVRVGPPNSPSAKATADANNGNAPLNIIFNGVASDPDNNIVKYEWDFDGDGIYEWVSQNTSSIPYSYTKPGNYYPSFRVTDETNLQAIDYMHIKVDIQASLKILKESQTFNINRGEAITILPSLSANIPAAIKIKNNDGSVVKSISVNNNESHIDWDGKDNSGTVVPDGVYYAILEYTIENEINVIDSSLTTGNEKYNPPFDKLPSTPYSFNPYADENLPVGFTLNKASFVSSHFICFEGKKHVRTLLNKKIFGSGHHTVYWDGIDDSGRLANYCINNDVIFGVIGHTLPDNAFVIQGGRPILTNFEADPNFFSPFSIRKHISPIKIKFNLSEFSNILTKIYPVGKTDPIRIITTNNISEGDNYIIWDGKDASGFYVKENDYRIAVQAQDIEGNLSMIRYTMVKISY